MYFFHFQLFIKVPKDHVWLQGDNIYDSIDSRDYGPVPIKDISGVVRLKVNEVFRVFR